MSRFATRFQALKEANKKAFIPFTLLGYPTLEDSKKILKTLVDAKPAALELGFPFSDPVADGAVIQSAVTETLANGYTLEDGFEAIAYARGLDAEIPIGVLVYYNTVLSQGEDTFFARLKEAGADACLIADLPPENAEEVKPFADAHGIELIFIVSPLTSADRFQSFAQYAGAFLYVVSRLGITGTEERYDSRLEELIARIREHTNLPLCVGFGISKPEHIEAMKALGFDGMITGSRILQVAQEESQGGTSLQDYLASMLAVV
jgi:tryptophan synthase alpha chain